MLYYLPSLTYYYNIYSVQEESSKIKKKTNHGPFCDDAFPQLLTL